MPSQYQHPTDRSGPIRPHAGSPSPADRDRHRADGHNRGHLAGGHNTADGRRDDHNGRHTAGGLSGQLPSISRIDRHPAGGRSDQLPSVSRIDRHSPNDHNDRHPAGGRSGQLPSVGHIGRHSPNDQNGGNPAGGLSGQLPSVSRIDRHPSDDHNDGHPAGGRSGQLPSVGHIGRYSPNDQNGGNPAGGRSGQLPSVSRIDRYPSNDHNDEHPAGGRSGRLPSVSHVGRNSPNDQNGGNPADDPSGGYPAADGRAGGFLFSVRPEGADPVLWSSFLEVDTDRSGSISVHELQRALVNADLTRFDPETVKLLISLFDKNQDGEINFDEFTKLLQYIEEWQRTFHQFDKNRTGTINSLELQALNDFDMKLPSRLVSLLVTKFSSSPLGSGEQTITFDRFIRACVFMKKFKKSFESLDGDQDGWVHLSYEQCLDFCLMLL